MGFYRLSNLYSRCPLLLHTSPESRDALLAKAMCIATISLKSPRVKSHEISCKKIQRQLADTQAKTSCEKLTLWPQTGAPRARLHLDFAGPLMYLLVVDL